MSMLRVLGVLAVKQQFHVLAQVILCVHGMPIFVLDVEIFSIKLLDKLGLMLAMKNNHNRVYNSKNPNQGNYKKVLCVCSAGLLRSPTAAVVLSAEPFNFNTRCAGIEESYALIPVDEVLLYWADEIVCMTRQHEDMLQRQLDVMRISYRPIKRLDVPDDFEYRDPTLMRLIKEAYEKISKDD
jgi:predicted protein tyrosine phosphatase